MGGPTNGTLSFCKCSLSGGGGGGEGGQWGHSNPTCYNGICLKFLHSEAVERQKHLSRTCSYPCVPTTHLVILPLPNISFFLPNKGKFGDINTGRDVSCVWFSVNQPRPVWSHSFTLSKSQNFPQFISMM